jgi:hypothetical protein
VLPDTQNRPGVPDEHLEWAGNYAVEKRPDVIVHLGDLWDFPSLSRHSEGKTELDAQDVEADIEAGNTALLKFATPPPWGNPRRNSGETRRALWGEMGQKARAGGTVWEVAGHHGTRVGCRLRES